MEGPDPRSIIIIVIIIIITITITIIIIIILQGGDRLRRLRGGDEAYHYGCC